VLGLVVIGIETPLRLDNVTLMSLVKGHRTCL
jgi:hypothetical protein